MLIQINGKAVGTMSCLPLVKNQKQHVSAFVKDQLINRRVKKIVIVPGKIANVLTFTCNSKKRIIRSGWIFRRVKWFSFRKTWQHFIIQDDVLWINCHRRNVKGE